MNPELGTEMIVAPVTLEGRHVRLEPLSQAHHADLAAVGLDEQLWRWIPVPVRTPDEMFAYIDTALDEQARGVSLPFALIDKPSDRAIGSTRYGNIDRAHHLRGDWLDLGRAGVATHRREHRSKISFATACV